MPGGRLLPRGVGAQAAAVDRAGAFSAKARAPSLASAVSKTGQPRSSSAARPSVSVISAVS